MEIVINVVYCKIRRCIARRGLHYMFNLSNIFARSSHQAPNFCLPLQLSYTSNHCWKPSPKLTFVSSSLLCSLTSIIIRTIISQKPSHKWMTDGQKTKHYNPTNPSFALCNLWLKKYLTSIFFSNKSDALWHTLTCLEVVIIVQLDCGNKLDWPNL